MSVDDLKKSISGGVTAPLYFFYGDNTPALDQAVALLVKVLFPQGAAELDIRHFDGKSCSPADILEAARTQGFFSAKKLIIVRQAHELKEAAWERLREYVKKPAASCCLVFILGLDEKDKKDKARIEGLKKLGPAYGFQNPRSDRQIMQFAKAQLASLGKAIDADALAYLAAALGESAQAIAGEVEKLALYCGDRKRVAVEDIDAVICGGGKGTIFNLVDAVGEGRAARSIELLKELIDSGSHGLVVLKMLSRQFRLIHTARLMLDQGEGASRIGQRLRLPEFVVKGIVQQAKSWPAARLHMVFEELFQASYLVKSSRAGSQLVLERLLLRLPELRA